ncbi:hypothetical protein N9N67_02000 [Bacteriovoracaceae bacterium]|nr:hypothetical protein [Bacteriovoracaceae bacterium]
MITNISDSKVLGTPINLIKYKTSHNSYSFQSNINQQITKYNFKAIELDIRKSKRGIKKPNDWWIYHDSLRSWSNVDSLRKALKSIRNVVSHDKSFTSQPLFLFLDIKKLPMTNRENSINEVERIFRQELGSLLFTYQDYISRCGKANNMLNSLKICGWPHESNLQRRVLVFISEGGGDFYFSKLMKKTFFNASRLNKVNSHTAVLNFPLSQIKQYSKIKDSTLFLKRVYKIKKLKHLRKAQSRNVNFIAIDENLKSY